MLFLSYNSRATHIIGGELTYELTDTLNYRYRITVKVYRDCNPGNAGFTPNLRIYFTEGDSLSINSFTSIPFPGSDTLPLTDVNDTCLTIPDSVCVEEAIYIANNVTLLPGKGGYYLTYEVCCRNWSIINIVGPNNTGATFTAYVPDTGIVADSGVSIYNYSNPVFNNFPPILVCKDAPLEFDHSATDIDGDSLVYELCTPYDDALGIPIPPYPPVTWAVGYSANNPLCDVPLGCVPLSINDSTGFLTGTPNKSGQFVVGVCVKEYRNGVFLSESKRDFQFNVTECFNAVASIADDVMEFCGDKTITFPNKSELATAWEWDFGDTTTSADTSNLEFPTYTYPDTGTYFVRLIVNPGSFCADTAYITVVIKPGIYADFDYIKGCVDTPISFFDSTIIDTGFIVNWYWDFGDANFSNDTNPTHLYDLDGVYTVTLIVLSNFGCLDTFTTLVTVYPLPVFNLGPDTVICEGDSLFYNFSLTNSPTYTWTPANGVINNGNNTPVANPKDSTTYYVQAINAFGCKYRDTIFIAVQPAPLVNAGPDDTIDRGVQVILQGNGSSGSGPVTFEWSPGDSLEDNITEPTPQTDPLFYTTTFYLKVTDQFGCERIDTVTIYVKLDPVFETPTAFTPNGDGKNEIFKLFYYDIEKLLYFRIFNRWGEKIFETTDLDEGWDGTYKDKPQEVGSYAYVAVGESIIKKQKVMIEKKGMVALIR